MYISKKKPYLQKQASWLIVRCGMRDVIERQTEDEYTFYNDCGRGSRKTHTQNKYSPQTFYLASKLSSKNYYLRFLPS